MWSTYFFVWEGKLSMGKKRKQKTSELKEQLSNQLNKLAIKYNQWNLQQLFQIENF